LGKKSPDRSGARPGLWLGKSGTNRQQFNPITNRPTNSWENWDNSKNPLGCDFWDTTFSTGLSIPPLNVTLASTILGARVTSFCLVPPV
jgi:hypothetical protein